MAFVTTTLPVLDGALDSASAEQLARVLKALGDPTRLRLLSLIAASDRDVACICDVTGPVCAYSRLEREALRTVAGALVPAQAAGAGRG
jgi:DNA-binding transcriptional ArsR family regulator